jgi:hypothetical protein
MKWEEQKSAEIAYSNKMVGLALLETVLDVKKATRKWLQVGYGMDSWLAWNGIPLTHRQQLRRHATFGDEHLDAIAIVADDEHDLKPIGVFVQHLK